MSEPKKKKKTKTPVKKANKVKLVENLTQKLLSLLKVKTKVEVNEDKEGAIHVQLKTDDPGMLIGYHGETLASFQLILGMMVYRQGGDWSKILVNVNDYRERRAESLERMALSAAQKVKFSNEPHSLPPMSPAERRIVHLVLANDEEVVTESEGEDRNRRVVIKPKS